METQAQASNFMNSYGTKGLPKFGNGTIDTTRAVEVAQLDAAFNTFMSAIKGLTAPGNEIALAKFGGQLEAIYWPAYNCVAGKPVISN